MKKPELKSIADELDPRRAAHKLEMAERARRRNVRGCRYGVPQSHKRRPDIERAIEAASDRYRDSFGILH